MSVIVEYFLAPSDADAASVVRDGPRRRFPSTDGSDIEPTTVLGQLQELLTGKTREQQQDDPDSYADIASADGYQLSAMRLEDAFVASIASADLAELRRLADPWSRIEEFAGRASPDALADFLVRLRTLAADAVATGAHIYCWVCV